MITRDLIGTNLSITQRKDASFNLDTILLSAFVNPKKDTKHIVDIGTGNMAILLYLSTKTNARLIGIEVLENKAQEALYNAQQNGLLELVNIINSDVNDVTSIKDACIVVSNPPYFKVNHNRINLDYERSLQRHEVLLNLNDLFKKAYEMLKLKGEFYLIHRPDRLEEIILTANKFNFNLKEIKFIHPYIDKNPNHVLCKFTKGANQGLKVLKPLILYKEKHEMTDDLLKLYNDFSL